MTTITFDTSENLAQTLYQFAQTKQKTLNETLNEIVQAYFLKAPNVSKNPKTLHKRYALNELLEGATPEFISELNHETEWAREGESVGRELT